MKLKYSLPQFETIGKVRIKVLSPEKYDMGISYEWSIVRDRVMEGYKCADFDRLDMIVRDLKILADLTYTPYCQDWLAGAMVFYYERLDWLNSKIK